MSLRRKPPAGTVQRPRVKGLNLRGQLTNKAGRFVSFESEAEHLLLLRLDRDPLVQNCATRPEKISYASKQGTSQTLIPDILVWRVDGTTELHVILSHKDSQSTVAGQPVLATQDLCLQRDWKYVAHIRENLSNKTEFANLQALFVYRPTAYFQSDLVSIAEDVLKNESMTILELIDLACISSRLAPPIVRGAIGHLIWHGQLSVDMKQLLIVRGMINPNAYIWLTQH